MGRKFTQEAATKMYEELKEILSWAQVERAPLREAEMESIRRVLAKAEGRK